VQRYVVKGRWKKFIMRGRFTKGILSKGGSGRRAKKGSKGLVKRFGKTYRMTRGGKIREGDILERVVAQGGGERTAHASGIGGETRRKFFKEGRWGNYQFSLNSRT